MKVLFAFLYFAFLLLTLVACFVPNLIAMGFHTDKMLHVFVVCVALLWPCLMFRQWPYIFVFAFCIFLGGATVEILQGLTPDRNPEWEDLLANVAGICVGLTIGYLIRSGYYAASMHN